MTALADIIIPVCATNWATFNLARLAIRTCAAHTPMGNILIYGNNIENQEWRIELSRSAILLGCRWCYIEGEFNFAQTFNRGIHETNSEFYGCFGQDVIFFPNWLVNLISLWKRNPQFFTLSPYSFDLRYGEPIISLPDHPQDRILETHIHCTAGQLFRRDKLFHYDESFPYWDLDSDLHQFIIHNSLREGICLNSRVDHLVEGVMCEIDKKKCLADKDFVASSMRLKRKWGLP